MTGHSRVAQEARHRKRAAGSAFRPGRRLARRHVRRANPSSRRRHSTRTGPCLCSAAAAWSTRPPSWQRYQPLPEGPRVFSLGARVASWHVPRAAEYAVCQALMKCPENTGPNHHDALRLVRDDEGVHCIRTRPLVPQSERQDRELQESARPEPHQERRERADYRVRIFISESAVKGPCRHAPPVRFEQRILRCEA
jgi:hypothetical protein